MEKKVTGFTLKMIAIVTMFIDHLAASMWVHGVFPWEYGVYYYMRVIGRMAFPIYCFLLVEGFMHTKSRTKYGGRLLLFAMLSEIPFTLALGGDGTNVFFTLFTGLAVISIVDMILENFKFSSKKIWVKFLEWFIKGVFMMAVIAIGAILADYVFVCDYGSAGVYAIVLLYFLRAFPMLAFTTATIALAVMSSSIEIYALFMLIPLYLYNGERGKQVKYFFYAFYPVHLFLIWLLVFLENIL